MANILETIGLERPLRRLLRRCGSEEYVKDGEWTKNPDEALSFDEPLQAAETCVRYGLRNMELVLRAHGGDVLSSQIR
jgi:hypothetical protein